MCRCEYWNRAYLLHHGGSSKGWRAECSDNRDTGNGGLWSEGSPGGEDEGVHTTVGCWHQGTWSEESDDWVNGRERREGGEEGRRGNRVGGWRNKEGGERREKEQREEREREKMEREKERDDQV